LDNIQDLDGVGPVTANKLKEAGFDSIEAIAKQRGCTRLLGSVTPSAKNATISVLNLLTYGFKVVSANNDFYSF
jgi:hypothetical protein